MSRLDDHVGLVRVKLTFATFVRLVPWALAIVAGAAFLAILVNQITRFHLPKPQIWLYIGLGMALVVPLVYAIFRRPTQRQVAVAIDERLGLKEKFSTALYVRSSRDPFAAAAVSDAERAANSADLHNKFPIAFPLRATMSLLAVVIVALLTFLIPPGDRFASNATPPTKIDLPQIDRTDPRIRVQQALAEIDRAPREVSDTEQIRNAKKDLTEILKKPITDAPAARERAEDALKRIEAIKQKIAAAQQYVTATNEMNILKNVGMPSSSDTGPVSDAHRAFAGGNLEEAAEDLKKVVDNFDKMSQAEKEKAAEQMKKLAEQVAKQADDPKVQQAIKDQLQKAGVDQKQADDIAKKMQQAANGVPDAAKQAQQMVNQAIQNANQKAGQNQTPQQQQAAAKQIQQAAQKAQQQANGQASAQQMAQSAKALSQAMQQAASQGKGNQGQQAQANGQQGAQAGGQQGGQQPGQQGQSQKGGSGQSGQGNGQSGGGGQSAQQQMQQQVGQLQAMAKDAQATNAGQRMAQGAGTGQQPGQQAGSGQGQNANPNPGQGQNGNGQQAGGQQPGPGGQGQGGQAQAGGVANGGVRPAPVAVPYQTVQELSKSQTIETGQIIANSFVKAPSERGEAKLKLTQAIEAKTKGEDGEVTTYRIPRGAQKAVKDYFDTLKQDTPAK